jgi:hypothetical protein
MLSPSQLQFRLMTLEAQCAAVQRLALHGCDARTISMHSGMSEADVHRLLVGVLPIDARMTRPPKWNRPRSPSAAAVGADASRPRQRLTQQRRPSVRGGAGESSV